MDENNSEYQATVVKNSGTEEDGQAEYAYTISRDSEEISTGTFTADGDATQEDLKAIALDEFSASGIEESDDSSDEARESELSSIEDDSTGHTN